MYKIVREQGKSFGLSGYKRGNLRILNETNNILHPESFTSMREAKAKIKMLVTWRHYNGLANGKTRTKKHNDNVVKLYKAKKVQSNT